MNLFWWRTWLMTLWQAYQGRVRARRRARHHLAVIALALFTGSTKAYTLIDDRHVGSTCADWED